MLKFKPNQEIKVYKVPNSKYNANILARVNKTIIITRPHIVKGRNVIYMDGVDPNSIIYGDYEFEGKKFYFRSKIIKSNFTPFPHIIITEPDEKNIKIIPIRKAERYKTLLPILIIFKKEEQIVKFPEAYALDFSKSGVGLISLIDLPENFIISFNIFGENLELSCERRVFIENKYKNFHFIGAEIMKISAEKIFERFIEHLKIINEAISPF